ncbi:hypothetical protein RI129_007865 [Pyrocoelia pectoralis]|uniref:Uncharacterized protein n=1 Tax=Pyrocoelia pectoralis TaxID=417401 RepID=A0AAN7V8R2_9COLE
MAKEINRVPPDGGWGWVIMFSYVISNLLIVPMQQNFGLLFKNSFSRMEMTGTNVTSIISTNISLSLLICTCTGPLIKRFGIRSLAVGGAILFTIGILTLTFATSYTNFMISYGILTGIGEGIIRLTNSLSLNLYFLKRRRKVAGVALAIRSMGSIIFPQLIVSLLPFYGTASSVLIIGGICFHTVCVSLLLRPVEWYMKKAPHPKRTSATSRDVEICLLGVSEKSTNELTQGTFKRILQNIIHYYDLTLFKNPNFLSIAFGMMFSVFADVSFETLFPLVLSDLNLDNQQIATFLSTSHISNVLVRIFIPIIGDYFKLTSKFMYGLGCCIVISGRFLVIYFASTENLAIPILWGVAHGIKTVYWVVIIADNIPPKQYPSAESIYLVLNGTTCLLGGPLLGWIKDVTGTYVSCVYVLNAFTFVTVSLWLSEWFYSVFKKKMTSRKANECLQTE